MTSTGRRQLLSLVVAAVVGLAGIGAALLTFRGQEANRSARPTATASPSVPASGPTTLAAAPSGSATAAADRGPRVGPDSMRAQALTMPLPRPHFVLTDTAGKRYDFAARTAGRVTLLYFGYTRCPDQCPTTLADIAMALRRTTPDVRAGIKVVLVSIDPEYDTPDRLGAYLRRFNPDFVGLTGTPAQVRAAQRAAGVAQVTAAQANERNPASPAHGSGVLIFTSDDQAHWAFSPLLPVGDIGHDLPLMVARSAHPHS